MTFSREMLFYSGRNVLVTGHSGFKGSWLSSWLVMIGAAVTGFSLPSDDGAPCPFETMGFGKEIESISGDIRNLHSILAAVNKSRPELIFHLAAQSIVRRSYRQPVETYSTNVLGTAHLLEAARRCSSVGAVIVVTSDKCYQNHGWLQGYREDEPLGGGDPYSSSKACAELVTEAYRRSFFRGENAAGTGSARSGNVIGGGDWAEDRLIPDIVRSLTTGKPVVLRNPGFIRPWQHVLEPLRGYLLLGKKLLENRRDYSEAWNFGPSENENLTVKQVAEKFINSWGQGSLAIRQDDAALEEACLLKLDSGKSRHRLGWQPVLTIDESIDLTVYWYRAYYDEPASASDITECQIKSYCSRLSSE